MIYIINIAFEFLKIILGTLWTFKVVNSFILLAASVMLIKKRWTPGGVGDPDRDRFRLIAILGPRAGW